MKKLSSKEYLGLITFSNLSEDLKERITWEHFRLNALEKEVERLNGGLK